MLLFGGLPRASATTITLTFNVVIVSFLVSTRILGESRQSSPGLDPATTTFTRSLNLQSSFSENFVYSFD